MVGNQLNLLRTHMEKLWKFVCLRTLAPRTDGSRYDETARRSRASGGREGTCGSGRKMHLLGYTAEAALKQSSERLEGVRLHSKPGGLETIDSRGGARKKGT